MNKVTKAILASNNSWSRLGTAAFFFVGYAIVAMVVRPYHRRDAVWAFVVCGALVWGLIELWRSRKGRAVKPDPRSQIRLS